MSFRLAVSASLSVLLMAGYVLLGSDAVRAPIGPASLAAPIEAAARVGSSIADPARLIPDAR